MTPLNKKYNSIVNEAVVRLLSRTENSRALDAADIKVRVASALERYLLRENGDAASADIKAFIDEIRADDLCLVIACEKGDEKAWEHLVANFDATVKSAARRISQNNEDAEDLASSIWAELYGLRRDSDGNKKSKLAYYSGRGSLAGWLRAVVSQLAVDQFRKQSKFVQIEENREFENLANEASEHSENGLVSHTDNPEELFSEKQTAADVSKALNNAIESLDAEDRLILKLYYFDDLKLKDIADMSGYHEATASRKLARVQTEIRKSVENALRNEQGWSENEVKRCLSETASKLEISVEKLFTALVIMALVQDFYVSCVL
ncbi:MAG: sigma-70 family RNA polymerase sigma factor [Blastocatellia bacterium]|nr:sigma-70 family RNA polymerase sigma factor [Blastocatellia bacterium]MDQ3221236.1 sigma-70 family RNA polymerase sigma factor [Acidobacteriota bacterium]